MTEEEKEQFEQVRKIVEEKCKELWEAQKEQINLPRIIGDYFDKLDRPYFESFEVKSKAGPNNSILVDITFVNPNQTLQRILNNN